jgi:hypothetical protein
LPYLCSSEFPLLKTKRRNTLPIKIAGTVAKCAIIAEY